MTTRKAIRRKRIPQQLQAQILGEQRNQCVNCGCAFTHVAPEFHHIDGKRNNNKRNNLVALCPNCHKRVHTYDIDVKTKKRTTTPNPYGPRKIFGYGPRIRR